MPFPFAGHFDLLRELLTRRAAIVDAIEHRLLNVRDKDLSRCTTRAPFEEIFNSCVFDAPGISPALSRLKGQLAASHIADGFEPVAMGSYSRELDPLELVVRAYRQWDTDRWPGRNARLTYAAALFGVFMLRQLEYLSLRIWDEGHASAPARLQEVQRLLDALNAAIPTPFVRDARWLVQTAQGPLTRYLEPYFRVADHIRAAFRGPDALEFHKAGATLAGGHLRSQLRYRSWEARRAIDDSQVLATTRNSNSMDVALLVHDLVPLLDAYLAAREREDTEARLDLADAILQGLSADPELLVVRLDLLGPATTIEDLFVERRDDGRVCDTGACHVHRELLARYGQLIGDAAQTLSADAEAFDPGRAPYSPLGIAYGFCADLLSNMALGALLQLPRFGLSLEDMFSGRSRLDDKLGQAQAWARLPTRDGERGHFELSPDWAGEMFARLLEALRARASRTPGGNVSDRPRARIYVVPDDVSTDALPEGFLPHGIVAAQEHCLTSDFQWALATGATAFPGKQLAADRNEGRFLGSGEFNGRWFGVSKVLLTACTSRGQDALITHVPPPVIDVLRLTCAELVVVAPGATAPA